MRHFGGVKVHFGSGAAARLGGVLADLSATRVLVVRGRLSYERSGAAAAIDVIRDQVMVAEFTSHQPNPTVADVADGLKVARSHDPDTIVGIGGGSVLDLAKAIAALIDADGEPIEYLTGRQPTGRRGLVLIPTTCGSGSELTQFATLYAHGRKHSLDFPEGRADVAVVDPDLSASVPTTVAAAAKADALSHAVESYWSVAATDESRALAWDAMTMLLPGTDHDQVAMGAALAGAAINLTRTTAAHALSYALTSKLGIPHGMAGALHMTWLIDHNAMVTEADCAHPDGPEAVRKLVADTRRLCRESTGDDLPDLYRTLLATGSQPLRLADLGLSAEWHEVWRAALGSFRGNNNPRVVTAEDVDRRQHG
nr:iron-containing alcohol dehydrogenase [Kibdelosporangium sp. MJ126-NF4]CEL18022.1 Alcohol dehydrogenase [Kibdelosporangium sp. MJ126-NF4]CTQ90750.1 Alcohol dehydrogenase (EC 1.1.1.1) [Kibdelosporangium sp. MJ126-NF4]